MRRSRVSAIVACALTLLVPRASGTVVPHKDLRTLVGESAIVVVGTVTGIQYERDERTGEVQTKVRLERLSPITGDRHLEPFLKEGLTLSFAGGLTDRGTFHVLVGMPELELGHTYLLFLRGGEWTLCPTTGWTQGVFEVVTDGVHDSQILLTLNGQVVVGVKKGELELVPVPIARLKPRAEGFDPDRVRSGLEETGEDLEQVAARLRDSIYREDNVGELEREDAIREEKAEQEQPAVDRAGRQRKLHELVGARPLALDAFAATVKDLDKRVRQDFDGKYRQFMIDPAPLPAAGEQAPPPDRSRRGR